VFGQPTKKAALELRVSAHPLILSPPESQPGGIVYDSWTAQEPSVDIVSSVSVAPLFASSIHLTQAVSIRAGSIYGDCRHCPQRQPYT
jgi:hypothetical protein